MRVGSSSASTHAAGMSSLWHDVDYIPEKQLYTPTVEKGLDDQPLPSEQHYLPPGQNDPFALQDEAYDVAAKQMDRGIRGMEFLYGKSTGRSQDIADMAAQDQTASPDEMTRTVIQNSVDAHAAGRMQHQQQSRIENIQAQDFEASKNAPRETSKATKGADGKDANSAMSMIEGLGVTMAAGAAAQAMEPTGVVGAASTEIVAGVQAAAATNLVAKTATNMNGTEDATKAQSARAMRRTAALMDALDDDNDEA